MARRKRIHAPEKDEPGLDISSLIDVCFLLLIYFLVTTQIVKKEQELSSTIPALKLDGDPPEIGALHILLEANGSVSIKNETGLVELVETSPNTRKLPYLSERLKLHKSISEVSGQQTLVQLQVNGDTVQQRVIDVLNALAGANITEITFTDAPERTTS
ncbi:MAG: biopolymer transport protein ExbD [Akkermansiaceae bacterium]|jgi:biopolymer transport protein ExbD